MAASPAGLVAAPSSPAGVAAPRSPALSPPEILDKIISKKFGDYMVEKGRDARACKRYPFLVRRMVDGLIAEGKTWKQAINHAITPQFRMEVKARISQSDHVSVPALGQFELFVHAERQKYESGRPLVRGRSPASPQRQQPPLQQQQQLQPQQPAAARGQQQEPPLQQPLQQQQQLQPRQPAAAAGSSSSQPQQQQPITITVGDDAADPSPTWWRASWQDAAHTPPDHRGPGPRVSALRKRPRLEGPPRRVVVPDAGSLQVDTLVCVNFRVKLTSEEAKNTWSSAFECRNHLCEGCGVSCRAGREGYLAAKIPQGVDSTIPQSTMETFMCVSCWEKFQVTPWALESSASSASSGS